MNDVFMNRELSWLKFNAVSYTHLVILLAKT